MQLEHVPLLQVQLDLYALPRGMERFRAYLQKMTGGTDDLALPLVSMNPMGREHVARRVEEWLGLGAEEAAASAAAEAEARLRDSEGHFRTGLVMADDVRGGWTNRYTTDAAQRFEGAPIWKRGWITTLLWASEAADLARLRVEVMASAYRAAYSLRHGPPKTLRDRMAQEGRAARFASAPLRLEPRALERARAILHPLLDSESYPVCFAALYGDEAASQLGYDPLGLPPFAGFAVALDDAPRESGS